MAPNIDSGGLFLASGATFAKQQQPESAKEPQKEAESRPRQAQERPKSQKSRKPGGVHTCLGGGSAAEAGSVKAFLADRQDEHRHLGVSFCLIHALTASGGRRIFRLPPLPPTPRFKDNDDGGEGDHMTNM